MPQSSATTHISAHEMRYLKLLAQQYPSCQAAYTEIINLEAILNLPKGTEHFMSDIHGELEAFTHILNNCSGVIRERMNKLFGKTLDARTIADLCTLIYYPDEKLNLMRSAGELTTQWYDMALHHLLNFARTLSDGYTRSKVRKALPEDYGYIIDELLHVSLGAQSAHHSYHERIVDSIIATGATEDFIRSLTKLIKRLAVDHLHVVGDIYDRGARPDRIIDELMAYHSVDIQWGNHDAAWMGAAAGSEVCIAQVVRNSIHYDALDVLESSYGISLRELALFAEATYTSDDVLPPMEKAISMILFKLMEQTIARHPNWHMEERCLLGGIDAAAGTVRIDGHDWPLVTRDFPTLDPHDPSALTDEERSVMDKLVVAFADSDRLRRQVGFLYEVGSVYLVSNDHLLFHGCVPLNEDGSFAEVISDGRSLAGKEYLDYVDMMARRAWTTHDQLALDWMWYLWCGKHSPLAGRTMKTFERTYTSEPSLCAEPKDPYYDLSSSADVARAILAEFDLTDSCARIVNGHTPVHTTEGESPVRADGHKLVIDGGFCSAYHATTGIAGYTLISDARGLRLKAHRPFNGVAAALASNDDIASASEVVIENRSERPVSVGDTDTGMAIRTQIDELSSLLSAYRAGVLKEPRARR